MDLRAAKNLWLLQSKELLERLRSSEGDTLTEVDLHIIRVQLRVLDFQAKGMQQVIATSRKKS